MGNLGSDRLFAAQCRKLIGPSARAAIHYSNFTRRILGAAIAVILGCLYALYSSSSTDDAWAVCILGAWASLQGLYPSAWYDVRKRVRLHNYILLAERWFSVAAVVLILELSPAPKSESLIWATALLIVRCASIFIQYILVYPRKGLSRGGASPVEVQWGGSLILVITSISNAGVAYGGMLVLKESASIYTFNAYAIVFQLLGIVNILQAQMLRVMVPGIARSASRSALSAGMLIDHSKRVLASSLVLILVCLFITPYALDILGSDRKHLPTVTYIVLYAWVLIYGVGLVVSQYMATDDLVKRYAVVSLCGGGLTLALAVLAVPRSGPVASATILLAVHSGMIVIYLWLIFNQSNPRSARVPRA